MKKLLLLLLLVFVQMGFAQQKDYVAISKQLIESVKSKNGKTQSYVDLIANANEDELLKQLKSDDERKAFFINTYNSFVIVSLRKTQNNMKTVMLFSNQNSSLLRGTK